MGDPLAPVRVALRVSSPKTGKSRPPPRRDHHPMAVPSRRLLSSHWRVDCAAKPRRGAEVEAQNVHAQVILSAHAAIPGSLTRIRAGITSGAECRFGDYFSGGAWRENRASVNKESRCGLGRLPALLFFRHAVVRVMSGQASGSNGIADSCAAAVTSRTEIWGPARCTGARRSILALTLAAADSRCE